MKLKMLFAVAAIAVSSLFTALAEANEGPIWLCRLGFQGQAAGAQVIVGKFVVKGKGDIQCVDFAGRRLDIPVKVTLSSGPIAARVAFGKYQVYGQSAEISLFNNDPNDMLGKYVVAQAQGAIAGGAGVITGAHVGIPDLTVALSLQFLKGFGLNVGVTGMNIELDEARL